MNVREIAPGNIKEIAEVATAILTISRYSSTAVYALQVYDWLLLFEEERSLIHEARWTSIKVCYLFCRYYPLVVFPLYLWAWLGDHDPASCARIVHPLYAFLIPFQLSAQAVICIRTYAFTGRNKYVFGVLGTSYLALWGAHIWLFGTHFTLVTELFDLVGYSGCYGNDRNAQHGTPYVPRSAFDTGMVVLCTFVLDFIMMTLVLLHCLKMRSTQGQLGKLFLQQGIGVFIIMSALNLTTASLYLAPDRQFDGFCLPYNLILSDIIACRLILTLRRKVSPTESQELKALSCLVREGLVGVESSLDVDEWAC